MRHCEKCDALNPDDALHCGQCGASLPPAGRNIGMGSSGSCTTVKESGVFRNAGPKLEKLAIVFAVIDLLAGEILAFCCIAEEIVVLGLILIFISPIIAWLSAILLYAFGELCENVNNIRYIISSKSK